MDVDTAVMTVVGEIIVGLIVVGAVVVSVVNGVVDFVVVRIIPVVTKVVVCEDVVVCWIVGEAVVWVVDDTKTESVLEADETSVL